MVGLHWAAAGESNENSFRLAHNHPKYAPSAQFDGHWIGVKYQVLGSLNQRLWCTLELLLFSFEFTGIFSVDLQ